MILLDTNVLSALMRATPDPAIAGWLDTLPTESVWLTAVTVFEVRFGLERLGAGRRRRDLEQRFARALEAGFENRIVPFDSAAAETAGILAAEQSRAGRSLEIRDLQIAGIARSRKAALATGNTRHFDGLGLALIDPWKT